MANKPLKIIQLSDPHLVPKGGKVHGGDPLVKLEAAIEHFANISHLMEPIMATATVTGEVLGTPNSKMREQLKKEPASRFRSERLARAVIRRF